MVRRGLHERAILRVMVAVTLADLAYRYRQFLIAVVGAGVVMAMALLLAGLVGGFGAETTQTVGGVGADRWVLTNSSGGRIAAVGVFPQSDVALLAHTPGVTRADPLVILPQEVAHIAGQTQTIIVMGATVGGLGDPTVTSGSPVSGPGQVVVDTGTGAAVGSEVEVGATNFRVVGQVDNRTLLGGVPMVYMSLHDAQVLGLGGRPLITAAVTTGVPTTVPPGLQVLTNQVVEQRTLDALAPGISSINNSKILMWFIAGIIIAALLYVSALQRVRDFAVLKALGSSTLALLGSLALQAVLVALAAAAFAAVISNFMGGIFEQPVAIPTSAFVALPIVAVLVGLLASLVALRQATGADPAAAFG
jgi:putative ABC transport system permease protein